MSHSVEASLAGDKLLHPRYGHLEQQAAYCQNLNKWRREKIFFGFRFHGNDEPLLVKPGTKIDRKYIHCPQIKS